MSVGAGSIKRAAKAASTNVVNNPAEEVVEKVVKAKEEKAPVAEKSAEKKAEAPKAAKKPAAKKTTAKAETKPAAKKETSKTTTKKAATKTTKPAAPKAEAKKSNYDSDYEAYGVGQQLPVHLM